MRDNDTTKTREGRRSDEDAPLEPNARSIRDLQSATGFANMDDSGLENEHEQADHQMPPIVIVVEGNIIMCNNEELTEEEMKHCKEAIYISEQTQSDEVGQQGGQSWTAPEVTVTEPEVTEDPGWTEPVMPEPTTKPSPSPSATPTKAPVTPATAAPSKGPTTEPSRSPSEVTEAPSYHPTVQVEPWVLSGEAYYDVNANGNRDSNVDIAQLGQDVEWNIGLGGVTIQLMECDAETNEVLGPAEVAKKYGESQNSYASTMTSGVDVLQHAMLAGKSESGGMYKLTGVKIDRAYIIYVKAPEGYLFSGGVCNDDVDGWQCVKGSAAELDELYGNNGRRLRGLASARSGRNENGWLGRILQGTSMPSNANAPPKPTEYELKLGIPEGRSERCVSVDRQGKPASHLDIGVMRLGEVTVEDTEVELNLDLIDPDIVVRMLQGRGLAKERVEAIRGRLLQRRGDPLGVDLTKEDKDAIGLVTSEVIASNLDKSLEKWGAVLDSVSPLDVVYLAPKPESGAAPIGDGTNSATSDARGVDTTAARDVPAAGATQRRPVGGKLAVSLLVRGHYNQGLSVDFDYVVQDSINRDTHSIRRQLTYYNSNCRDQTTKVVDLGFTLNDFVEIHSTRGVKKPANRLENRQEQEDLDDEQVFSSACNQKKVLPEYFEEAIGGLEVRAKAKPISYTVEEGGTSTWLVVGIVLAVGLCALSVAVLLFYRGLTKRQKKRREARVTHIMASPDVDEVSLDSVGKKIHKLDANSRAAKEKNKGVGPGRAAAEDASTAVPVPVDQGSRQRGLAGMMRREFGNMTAALGSERARLGGRGDSVRRAGTSETTRHDSIDEDLEARLQSNLSDGADDGAVPAEMEHIGATSGSGDTDSTSEEAASDSENVGLDQISALGGSRNARSTAASLASRSAVASCTSRNAAPKIVSVDFSDDSSSSSDGEDSSDSSSSSSSSSEESETSSNVRSRKRRERKAASKKGRRKQKRGGNKLDQSNKSSSSKRSANKLDQSNKSSSSKRSANRRRDLV